MRHMRRCGRSGALLLAIVAGGCMHKPDPGRTFANCAGEFWFFPPAWLAICGPAAAVESARMNSWETKQRRSRYLERLEWIGVLPETEISPAGEIYLDTHSPRLNDRGRIDAKLVVDLDYKSSLKEYSIEFDVEADCAVGTLHARNAKSTDDVGGWGGFVAYRPTPTDPIQGMHPVLKTSLDKVCESTPLAGSSTAKPDQPPPPPKGSNPGLFDPPYRR